MKLLKECSREPNDNANFVREAKNTAKTRLAIILKACATCSDPLVADEHLDPAVSDALTVLVPGFADFDANLRNATEFNVHPDVVNSTWGPELNVRKARGCVRAYQRGRSPRGRPSNA